MDQVLKNFSTHDFRRDSYGDPLPASLFAERSSRRDPRLDACFCTSAWMVLQAALDAFCEDGVQTPESEVAFLKCLRYTQELVPRATENFDANGFAAFLMDYEDPEYAPTPALEYQSDELVAAYVVLSIDRSISAMMSGQAKDSAKFAMFAGFAALLLPDSYSSALTTAARRAAERRHEKDPKQQEKKFIHDCWKEWRKKPEQYRYKAAFAKDMLDKCEHLTSQKKIEDWCREWEKEAKRAQYRANALTVK